MLKKEKPIIFSTEMVRAILENRKSKTRRVIKPQPPENSICHGWVMSSTEPKNEGCAGFGPDENCVNHYSKCPWEVGQILWVRETWSQLDADYRAVTGKFDIEEFKGCPIIYKADENPEHFNYWRSSIYMPRSAARLLLKVKDIRVERLQEITEEDARCEGCIDYHDKIGDGKLGDVAEFDLTARDVFADLWESINLKRGYGWHLNPWVFVISFEKVEGIN